MTRADIEVLQTLFGHNSVDGPASQRPVAALLVAKSDQASMNTVKKLGRYGVVGIEDVEEIYPGCVSVRPTWPRKDAEGEEGPKKKPKVRRGR